jgi:ubiquinone/menaquinone biosynthesis C-methylase UbiE
VSDFGPVAAAYDRLRPVDANWHELFEVLADEGDFRGRRVLDVGCGTGRLTVALADHGAKAWGVDPSAEMLAEARRLVGRRAGLKLGRAEELPFKDGWFERAVMRLVVQHVERTRALPELRRVLAPGGRAVIATFHPAHFHRFWLNRYFPSIARIDSGRFPVTEDLASELEAAGFADVRVRRLFQRGRLTRDDALTKLRGRYISTLRLLDEDEFEAGLARAHEEIPDVVEYELDWAIVVAERP